VPLTLAPDLVIKGFARLSAEPCVFGKTLYNFTLGIKNECKASWTSGSTVVAVRDLHPGVSWGVSVTINPPIAPGETRNVPVPVPYYSANADHMLARPSHPFAAFVNENHAVKESSYASNTVGAPGDGLNPIAVARPDICSVF
jgi:hypothetical protein